MATHKSTQILYVEFGWSRPKADLSLDKGERKQMEHQMEMRGKTRGRTQMVPEMPLLPQLPWQPPDSHPVPQMVNDKPHARHGAS